MAVKGRKAEILLQRRVIPVCYKSTKSPCGAYDWKTVTLLLKPVETLHTPAAYHPFFISLPFLFFPPCYSAFSTALYLIQLCKTSQIDRKNLKRILQLIKQKAAPL